jgi:hypothetical protein
MNNLLFKSIFNSPRRKCRFTRSFYPASLMTKLILSKDINGKEIYLPDSLYGKVK